MSIEHQPQPVGSMSTYSQPKSDLHRKKSNSSLKLHIRKIKNDESIEIEIERFEKQFIEPLSEQLRNIDFQHLQSKEDFVNSDPSCDSGTFSRNTTPDPINVQKLKLQDNVEPLKSPPLVMSIMDTNKKTLSRN